MIWGTGGWGGDGVVGEWGMGDGESEGRMGGGENGMG